MRLALESELTGYETFIIAAADTVMRRSSEELITGSLEDLERTTTLDGRTSLFSVDKARRMLGYEPAHSWTDTPQ